jgi:hypothetical protein
MMCRVVKHVQLPLFKYAPIEPLALAGKSEEEPPHNTNDIIPHILPEPTLTTNRKDFLSTVRNHSLKASVSKIFGLDSGLSNEQQVKLESKEVRRYTLNNPGEYFKALMQNELYERDVRDLLGETSFGTAYLVIGFLTTSDALWSQERTHKTRVEMRATVPVTEIATGVPIPGLDIDPTLAVGASKAQTLRRTHTSPDEEIFAIAYAQVKSSKLPLWGKKKVVIGRAKAAGANHLAFGANDSDDLEEDSDDSGSEKPTKGDTQGNDIQLDDDQEWGEEYDSFEF